METLTGLGLASVVLVVWFTWHTARSGVAPLAAIIEAWANVCLGFSLNYLANLWLLPMVGAHLTASSNFWLGCVYTAVSVLRSYAIRLGLGDRIKRFALSLDEFVKTN